MINETDPKKAIGLFELNGENELVYPNCNSSNVKVSLGKKIITALLSMLSGVPFSKKKT